MQITRTSKLTGATHTMEIPGLTPEQLAAYEAGGLIQKVLPHLSADEREFIKSGITPEEWEEHLG